MTKEEKIQIGNELLNNMDLTKEQYTQMCMLAEELDLELIDSGYVQEEI